MHHITYIYIIPALQAAGCTSPQGSQPCCRSSSLFPARPLAQHDIDCTHTNPLPPLKAARNRFEREQDRSDQTQAGLREVYRPPSFIPVSLFFFPKLFPNAPQSLAFATFNPSAIIRYCREHSLKTPRNKAYAIPNIFFPPHPIRSPMPIITS